MKEKISLISLRTVRDSDGEFLFELLKERDPRANISHKKMPSYDEHIKFIKSKPYTRWYIILKSKERVGSIYLSNQVLRGKSGGDKHLSSSNCHALGR